MLITLTCERETRTVSFDQAAQSVVWLGMRVDAGPETSVARLDVDSEGVRLIPAKGCRVERPTRGDVVEVLPDQDLVVDVADDRSKTRTRIYLRPLRAGLRRFRKLGLDSTLTCAIGRTPTCGLAYQNRFVSGRHAELSHAGGRLTIVDVGSANGTAVNGCQLVAHQPRWLAPGDVVEILDLVIAVGVGFVCVNDPPELVVGNAVGLAPLTHEALRARMPDVEPSHEEPEAFSPAPRLSKSVHPLTLQVDDPPARKAADEQSVLAQVGPSLLMGLSSVLMLSSTVWRTSDGHKAHSMASGLFLAATLVVASVVWPIASRAALRRRDERDELRRERVYVAYLDGIENRLATAASEQAQVLGENRRPVSELIERARTYSALLMSHTSAHDDYLELRVGIGDDSLAAEVTWPQHHVSLEEDPMLDAVDALAQRPPQLRDVPLAFNLLQDAVAGIIGERAQVWEFLRGLLVQVCALYSYHDVKIVMLSSEDELPEWEFLTHLGHLYDAAGQHRHVAIGSSGLIEEDRLLLRELAERAGANGETLRDAGPTYLVICANQRLARRSEAVGRLLRMRERCGISLIYLGTSLSDLPRECISLVDLSPRDGERWGLSRGADVLEGSPRARRACMFARSDVVGTLRQFDPDIMVSREQAHAFALSLARVRLASSNPSAAIPASLAFLELLEVGSVAHLNIGHRWAKSDASQSLQAIVGVGSGGEPIMLDLHERAHGPHGLIAGTTGSGKSEFIITYLLSMCVNYAPDEVAFVVIDYKGGGLAGALENERHHMPHLAGTITNLDGGVIQRALASISGELRRRQDLLNRARETSGEATVDIYQYLSLYRQGVVSEPLPHLLIVADEFAELKAQEPAFMDELISAARIGRSLGVHLILATQKPSGVVNEQIWSNARFKVCLKVADAADSREMIRRDDAAEIAQPGRFYLLVGYNESCAVGQAAYAGGPYVPTETFEPRRDDAVELLDAEGTTLARLRPPMPRRESGDSELTAVLGQIEATAAQVGKRARRLWLDPLPTRITLASLSARYGTRCPGGLVCRAGEVDDPENQRQLPLEIDLATVGAVMLYGSQGSDVDGLLRAMLVSLADSYGPDHLWLYGIDYGAGLLSRLEGLPHVGGVVPSGDTERLGFLLRMLERMVAKRRGRPLTREGGGGKDGGPAAASSPRIVVAIDNLAAFQELNEELVDTLVTLTRDAPRYGIHFVMTAATADTPRMRLRAQVGMELPTMLNDRSDYVTILGALHDVTPPHRERRGLVRMGKRLLEFQGLSIAEDDEGETAVIARVAASARERTTAIAPPIPALPPSVHIDHLGSCADARRIPIGLMRRSLDPVWYDLARTPHLPVLGNDAEALSLFLRGLHDAAARMGAAWRFVDPHALLGATHDAHVLSDEDEVVAFVEALCSGAAADEVVVFTNVVSLMQALPESSAQRLQDYIASEQGRGRTALVIAFEFWRVRSLYQDWYRVVTATGRGVWVGGGFSDQTVLRFAQSRPEYRAAAKRSDGFVVTQGGVQAVRLLEPQDEPQDVSV